MRAAIVGSRSISIDLMPYLPRSIYHVVSGGAKGIDQCAMNYAKRRNITITIIRPDYSKYNPRIAPLKRNDLIIAEVDHVFAFWDGRSRGTSYVVRRCREIGKGYTLFKMVDDKVELVESTIKVDWIYLPTEQ